MLSIQRGTTRGLRDECCVTRILEVVSARPNAVAVQSSDRRYTYEELLARSASIRHALGEAGAGAGSVVGVALERSAELIPALLAIWLAGAIYVPLDPEYPASRLQLFAKDAGVTHLLSEAALASRLALGVPTVLLRDVPSRRDFDPRSAPTTRGEDVAYLLHTSGSTGRPKVVAVAHRSVVNLLSSFSTHPGLSERDLMLAVAPVSFDVSLVELLLPIYVGASVFIASRDQARSGSLLALALEQTGATLLQATPTMLRLLVETDWQGSPRLRVWSGGEPLAADLGRLLLERASKVYNVYGPTEATMWITVQEVTAPLEGESVPVGLPIDNSTTLVVGDDGRPVERGVVGEVCLGGANVAIGYWGNDELTRSRFVPSPAAEGEVMYRTGDLGCMRDDGVLLLLGRSDDQVKVGGRRLELGEIETCLRRHPGVRNAVVVLATCGSDKYLAAYVTPAGSAPSPRELRQFVTERLPDYMVPRAFVPLDSLPLLPNGKLDRKSLPDPHDLAANVDGAATDDVERELLAVARDVMHAPDLAAGDEFTIGAFSLGLVRLCARLKPRYPDLRVVDLYTHNTVSRLAVLCRRSAARDAASSPSDEHEPPAAARVQPVSDWTWRMIVQRLCMPGAGMWNDLVAFEIVGDAALLRRAWQLATRDFEALRSRFEWQGLPRPVRVIDPEAEVSFEEARAASLDELKELQQRAFVRDFDLGRTPLSRVLLVHLPDGSAQMIWVYHHAILDGQSAPIVLESVLASYDALRAGRDPRAPGPRASANARATDEKASSFWPDTLEGAPRPPRYEEHLGLGAKDTNPMAQEMKVELGSAIADRVARILAREPKLRDDLEKLGSDPAGWGSGMMSVHPAALTRAGARAAEHFALTHRVSLTTVFQAAWALHLMATTGGRDVVFGVMARTEDDAAVGNVAVELPLRVRVGADEPVGAWLQALQKVVLTMLDHPPIKAEETKRSLGNDDFMNVMFVDWSFWSWPSLRARFPALGLARPRVLSITPSKLVFCVLPGEPLTISLAADECSFDAQRIPLWLTEYVATLDRLISAAPTASVESVLAAPAQAFGLPID